MKKSILWLVSVLFLLPLAITSCEEDTGLVNPYGDWKNRNQQYIDSIAKVAKENPSEWKVIHTYKFPEPTDPLAAKIAGRVFTLNYIPVRQKDIDTPERSSVRKAMAASDGKVTLLRYSDPTGRDAYRRTAQFVLFLAIRRLWPEARAKMNCTVGSGLYVKVIGATDFSSDKLKEEVWKIVAENIVLTDAVSLRQTL